MKVNEEEVQADGEEEREQQPSPQLPHSMKRRAGEQAIATGAAARGGATAEAEAMAGVPTESNALSVQAEAADGVEEEWKVEPHRRAREGEDDEEEDRDAQSRQSGDDDRQSADGVGEEVEEKQMERPSTSDSRNWRSHSPEAALPSPALLPAPSASPTAASASASPPSPSPPSAASAPIPAPLLEEAAPFPGWLRAGASAAQSSAAALPPLSPTFSSSSSSMSLTLTFAARHLPPSLEPILCLLQLSGDGSERLVGHTEVHHASMSPAWKKRLTVELLRGQPAQPQWPSSFSSSSPTTSRSTPTQRFRLAIFDASNLAQVIRDREGDEEEEQRVEGGRGSLLHRLLTRRRSSAAKGGLREESARGVIAASELTSDDLVGAVIVELSQVGSSSRHLVTQRLHLRHPTDHDVDKRLLRLSAHILLTIAPTLSHAHAPSPKHSPRTASASSTLVGPTCGLPFSAAYRLLCRGSLFLKFPFSSSARPQRRLVFFSRHPLSPAQVVAQAHPLFDPLTDQSPPNPLFPLGLLYWCSPGRKRCSASRCLPLHAITGLYERCQTPAFMSLLIQQERERQSSLQPNSTPSALDASFSVVSRERTLDLVADSCEVRDAFLYALHCILVDQGRLWYADAAAQEEKRQEEKRRYNERQSEQLCSVAFVAKHLPMQASAGECQLRLRLSKAGVGDGGDGGERGEVLGWSEWVELDDSLVFLTVFFLPLPESTRPSSASADYHIHLYDLSHALLARASFSAALLLYPHLDIPLSLRHDLADADALLTVQRSVCTMRVQPIAGPDKPKGDILDVIGLLQAQPSYNPSLPYLTLSFLLRGEPCTYYPEPSFLLTPTVLLYHANTCLLSLCGHELPLSSLLRVHRQLRPASSLYAALCAVHPEKRINSKRMVVLDAGELGEHCVEMRSVLSADAWVSGLRQLMRKKGTASRAQLETEELQWTKQGADHSSVDDEGEEDGAEEEDGGSRASKRGSVAESQPSMELPHSQPHTRGGSRHRLSSDWRGLSGMAAADDGGMEEEAELRVRGGAHLSLAPSRVEEGSEVALDSAHLTRTFDHGLRPAVLAVRDEVREAEVEVESPDFHSRASSFSSLFAPDFHLSDSSESASDSEEEEEEGKDSKEEDVQVEEEKASEAEEAVAALLSDEVPMAPPMMDGVPPAPPMDGAPCPGDADEAGSWSSVKLKKLHWEVLGLGCDLSGTIFATLDCSLDEASMELLVDLFAAAPPPSSAEEEEEERKARERKAATALVELIDPRRGQNVAIALRGLKLPIPQLIAALHSCDLQLLTLERVQTLVACHPDALEVRQVRAYTGDEQRLGMAERYIRAVSDVPRASTRLQLLLFLLTFSDALANLQQQCALLSTACERLRSSARLAAALQVVLAVGCALNAKRTGGFRLSSLDKLTALKSRLKSSSSSSSSSMSLLDFVVDRCLVQATAFELCPPHAADAFFASDLGPARLHEAAKADWPALCNDVRALGEQLQTVRREHDREELRTAGQAPFRALLHSFLSTASPQLTQLEGQLRSTTLLLQSTLSYFGQPDDSAPSELFACVERFVSHFGVSEARWWARAAADAKRAELEERKRRWREEQEEERRETEERQRRVAAAASALGADGVQHIHYSTLTDVSDGGRSSVDSGGSHLPSSPDARQPPPPLLHSAARPLSLHLKKGPGVNERSAEVGGGRFAGLSRADAKMELEAAADMQLQAPAHPPLTSAGAAFDLPSSSTFSLSLSSEHLSFF